MSKRESKFWKVTYTDGYTAIFSNPFRATGNASRHLHAEKNKGRDHGSISSIREIAPEAVKQPIVAKSNHATETLTLPEVVEEIKEIQEVIDAEADNELYNLIQAALLNVEKTEKLLYKLYELSLEGDIYDDIFLREFVKRVSRSVDITNNDLELIERNLVGEE